MRCSILASATLALAVLCAPALSAQVTRQQAEERLRTQAQELDRVRRERADLETRMKELQQNAHSLTEEMTNLDRQADATARLVASLDQQLASIEGDLTAATAQLERAEFELGTKKDRLQNRLTDIYKRGPLATIEVLLSAESFGQLLTRYKYLQEFARIDRALVGRVQELRDETAASREMMVRLQNEILRNRREKAAEEDRLRQLEAQRGRSLTQNKAQQRDIQERLAEIARDEQRLASMITGFETARRRAEARTPSKAPVASTLKTSDFGRLDWPVEGDILYRFGRAINPNNTMIRWNGIGIAAATGTSVRAVSSGEVVVAEGIGTYGSTVILQHGGGDYSVYGSLARIDVRKGGTVQKGDIIGTVGSADPGLPPHLHFEMRPRGRAVDPLEWLRNRR
ncbi:MAG: peptidoglycan DD-metalloendopeptidase family protein [Gemmatimonadaceae bacterium]|nr:peptidoglycan DD-metalloendopeptidase family protein [Gemmatimonadaceae bacterium]